ncbi:NUDIX hydrolase [Candidatus Woesebacteria bacterium]|nr:NUDIX hydrolase [Candidatus Woesebacteria bacterium]MCD8507074.1 NUDIX hydrolase [Candidatus Woesebacteria bacterium]MCD8527195.1 NUDIX hydrolase [Candidatus Woesebacteria bacterium]MCD8546560.1 NUDIX hydrolase [Candidatus Woesebacteria bacterium]
MTFTLPDIDTIRTTGFRPTAVACFVHDRKVLLVFHEAYRLWQLPQGGVDNGELPRATIVRESAEELGETFAESIPEEKELTFVGRDRVEFLPSKYNVRDLKLDSGEPVLMKGKEYLFFAVPVESSEIKLAESEFSQYEWHSYESAQERIEEIYQPGKQRITRRAVQFLRDEKIID